MKKYVFLVALISCFTASFSQSTTIAIEFVKNSKVVKLDSKSTVNLVLPTGMVVFPILNGRLTVPDSVKKGNQQYFSNLNGHLIGFKSIPFSWHEKVKLPQWSIILDEYPIEDERQYLLRDAQQPVK